MEGVSFILCDPKKDLCTEWQSAINSILGHTNRFTIVNGKLENVKKFDCIVSPANSYARLDGAFDAVISQMISPQKHMAVTQFCQGELYKRHNGYQTPGTACLIEIPDQFKNNVHRCSFILHCPTMRTPGKCKWNKEVVYNCMWNLLTELHHHNAKSGSKKINSVFITGLGTGVGAFPSSTCAQQMILAYKHFLHNLVKSPKTTSWQEAYDAGIDIEQTCRTFEFLN